MTFKGDTIVGKPTLTMVEIYIAEKGLFCDAKECFDYWENKEWLTKKGVESKTLEIAIDCYNSIALNRFAKRSAKSLGITKLRGKKKKSEMKILRRTIASRGLKGLENQIKIESFEAKKKVANKREYAPYKEQLNDKRWEAFRKFIFTVRGCKCEMCGATEKLQVHHPNYIKGRKAWEYTCNEVVVLCEQCHRKAHGLNY